MGTEWDEAKNAANRAKHGLDFADFVGFDSPPRVIADDRKRYGEPRFRAFGRIDGLGHCLAFTLRGTTMRLIRLRRAHEKEMRRYG
jgi:uncharacterized DUF497 family protein